MSAFPHVTVVARRCDFGGDDGDFDAVVLIERRDLHDSPSGKMRSERLDIGTVHQWTQVHVSDIDGRRQDMVKRAARARENAAKMLEDQLKPVGVILCWLPGERVDPSNA